MQRRIVIYQAARFAADEELLSEIEGATGADRASVAKLLKTRRAVFLNDLEETSAQTLSALLESRRIDFDLEPVEADPDKLDWLAAELPKWGKRGLIPPASLASVSRNYGLEMPVDIAKAKPTAADPRKLVRAVLALGATLVGLGLVLFVASNWERLPDAVKIGGALVLALVSLHGGHRFQHGSRSRPLLAATLFVIALFAIGGALLLVAQTYHVEADSYLLPLVWGALCVPVALFQRFKPALYLASALWLWSYWLFYGSHDQLMWFYPLLLLGFLIPYALAVGDRLLFRVHIGVLLLALVSTLATEDFWLCSIWVAALVFLKVKFRKQVYDWLLLAGFVCWHFAFMVRFENLPNLAYALPVAYFFFRAWKDRSNGLMIAAVANAWLWALSTLAFTADYFDLEGPEVTDVLLWILSSGLLLFGVGIRTRERDSWRSFSIATRSGGVIVAGLMVYVLSFRFYAGESEFFDSPLFLVSTLLLGLLGVALAGPLLLREAAAERRWGAVALLVLSALSLVLAAVLSAASDAQVVLFNLILFVLAMVLMLRGHRQGHLGWYNAGIGLFVVLIVSRYLDTFVDLLPRSVFFLFGGGFLIGWAVLVDRQRRRHSQRKGSESA